MPEAGSGIAGEQAPRIWISLAAPQAGVSDDGWLSALVGAALESGTVIDISKGPALWGGALRGTDAPLMSLGGTDIERAVDAQHAQDLLEAHLIETLSAVGRERLDYYFLQVRRGLRSWQVEGALRALELAKGDGHVGQVGLCCDGPPEEVAPVWQASELFDALMVPRSHARSESYEALAPLARSRNKLLVTSKPLNWGFGMPFVNLPVGGVSYAPAEVAQAAVADLAREYSVLVAARTPEEVRQAVGALRAGPLEGFQTIIAAYRQAWNDPECWARLKGSSDPISRKAAERRLSA